MCFITVPIELSLNNFIHKSPIFETVLTLLEKERSPMILLAPLTLKSKTGNVLIFAPTNFSK